MKLKVGDAIRISGMYIAVITRVPKGGMDDQYSFLYSDGAVDEEDEEFLADNAEIVGHIGDVPKMLKTIEYAPDGRLMKI